LVHGPGDFIFVPPYVPHQEINADPSRTLECLLVRSDNEAVVVNINEVEPVEKPEEVYWVESDPSTAVTQSRARTIKGGTGVFMPVERRKNIRLRHDGIESRNT
jgi:hypothetical protein